MTRLEEGRLGVSRFGKSVGNGTGARTKTVILSGPTWVDGTNGTATVTWVTNVASDSTVFYGATAAYGSNETNASLVTSHSIVVTAAAATYHFQVVSVVDGQRTFTADATGAITGP